MKLTLKPLCAATIFALSGIATQALAQDTDQDSSDDAQMLEEIVVTGSRIRQDPLDQRTST
jgi:hypothetical protein